MLSEGNSTIKDKETVKFKVKFKKGLLKHTYICNNDTSSFCANLKKVTLHKDISIRHWITCVSMRVDRSPEAYTALMMRGVSQTAI